MLKLIQYGCGKMAKYAMRYALEKGYEIVGAYDINEAIIGKDISEIMELDTKTGIVIRPTSEVLNDLKILKPDACVVMTLSLLDDIKDIFKICAENGVNAISTAEEAIFPWNSKPHMTKELDELAKVNNCTLTGSGYQDIFWGSLISTLAGATHKITKIKGSSSYNVEDYGIVLAKAHGAGLTTEEFEKEIARADNISIEEREKLIDKEEFVPSYMWNQNGYIASALGLTITKQIQKCVPKYANDDLMSETLNMKIEKGTVTGMSAVVTTETKEGIIIESEAIGKVYDKDDQDTNDWTVEGEPNTRLVITNPATVELTCATIINRLEDLMAAEPGYVTTEKMPHATYKKK